jgi:hypothetical protein
MNVEEGLRVYWVTDKNFFQYHKKLNSTDISLLLRRSTRGRWRRWWWSNNRPAEFECLCPLNLIRLSA